MMASLRRRLARRSRALSWNLIEKRALALKGDFAAATSRAFNLGLAKIAGVVR